MHSPQKQNVEKRPRMQVREILTTTMVAWIPAQFIDLALKHIYPGPVTEMPFLASPFRSIALMLIIAPVIETYGLRFILHSLNRFIKKESTTQLVAAVFWGVMHWESESWGLHASWAFYVMGKWYLRSRVHSVHFALYTTMVIHAIFNALSYAVYLLLPG